MVANHYIFYRLFFAILMCFLCLASLLPEVNAQTLGISTDGIRLTTTPKFPGPNEKTKVSLDDYSLNTLGSTISWYIDGIPQENLKNNRSIEVTTGDLGKKTTVRVQLTKDGTLPLTYTLTLIPTQVDLILETDTYTPIFYEGRALPSKDANIRAIALVHDNSGRARSEYTYRWSENSTILYGGAMKGKYSIDRTMPQFDGKRLTVEVFDSEGVLIAQESTILRTTNPELYFYEENPLRGLTEKAITADFPLISDETTIYGEPYFLNATMSTNDADFIWRINNQKTISDSVIPNSIILSGSGSEGKATIQLDILTKTTPIPQVIRDSFNIFFDKQP